MAKTMLIVTMLLVLLLTGCAEKEFGPNILEESYYPLQNGKLVAELWVEAPDKESRLVSDSTQDVVCLEYAGGKMALPDKVSVKGFFANGVCEPGGVAYVAMYHLITSGKETSYYKRRFARRDFAGQ